MPYICGFVCGFFIFVTIVNRSIFAVFLLIGCGKQAADERVARLTTVRIVFLEEP